MPTEANTSTTNEYITALWFSPDEWLIFKNNVTNRGTEEINIEENLFKNISHDDIQVRKTLETDSTLPKKEVQVYINKNNSSL